jgi:hypothetical protein
MTPVTNGAIVTASNPLPVSIVSGSFLPLAGGTLTGSVTFSVPNTGPILKQGSNGRVGTFIATGVTPVAISNTTIAITDAIIISMNTAGGTPVGQPYLVSITASSGFSISAGVGDTSTYNYAIIKSVA